MSEAKLFLDRQCHKCHGVFNVSAAALTLHKSFCTGPVPIVAPKETGFRNPRTRVGSLAGKVSNRQRQKMAIYAMAREAEHKFLLLAVLAQKGGEVTITRGTIEQLTDDMSYEVVPNPADATERIVRIVK